ncbi:FecR domain-containing protein [Porticoccus sp. W117]|uniref:FecR family protein n=1 Tax=Porticoccus sp. W117 TaxID=3054777 RepID=UPI0025931F19|nr:FecR domain-containing protein [Porticoccus sp. W117]MDM3870070.1 FecR domain-containing protein [Porticoccus sp. W117]
MENIYEFPDRSLIEKEAGEWIIKLDSDSSLSAEEELALREWLGRSSLHREKIETLARFWGNMNVLTELAVPLGKHDSQRGKRRGRKQLKWLVSTAVAASLIVSLVVLSPLFKGAANIDSGLYATAVGQQRDKTLVDGSVVQLNTNSQIRIDYSEGYRDIYLLQGEAHFTVAKDAERPFRVYAGRGRVQAIGTAFSVRLKGADVSVTVTEGEVGLVALQQEKDSSFEPSAPQHKDAVAKKFGHLKAGQITTIKNILASYEDSESSMDPITDIDQHQMDKQLSWRKGLLMFTGDPLEMVVAEISRYSTVSIEINDPEVRAIKIGGQFRVGETEAMLDSLESNFGLHVQRTGYNQVVLSLPE